MELDETLPMTPHKTFRPFFRQSPTTRLKNIIGEANRLCQANTTALIDAQVNDRLNKARQQQQQLYLLSDSTKGNQGENIYHRKPKVHFRSICRFLVLLIRTCLACRKLLTYTVEREQWYGLVDNVVADEDLPKKRTTRPFVALSLTDKREIVKLTFDVADYSKDVKVCLTHTAIECLQKPATIRSDDDINVILLCLKTASPVFSSYPLEVQKDICRYGLYDSYSHNRVLVRPGKPAHGMYILIRGLVLEKCRGERNAVREIAAGGIFGQNDVILGTFRNSTLITKTACHILFVHKADYRKIFDMSEDCHNTKALSICRRHAVFQHFPMHYLTSNPGVWSIWRYKHGRLIVKDSNDTAWIYVIKSGEARVIKRLTPGTVDVKARRRKIQAILAEESPYEQTKKILNFISERDYTKSVYRRGAYYPGLRQHSAPVGYNRRPMTSSVTCRSLPSSPFQKFNSDPKSKPLGTSPRERSSEQPLPPETPENFTSTTKLPYISTPNQLDSLDEETDPEQTSRTNQSTSDRVATGGTWNSRRKQKTETDFDPNGVLPPFVLVETLYPGDAFGFRSCLDPADRGPSASLVSAECEVIKINKKFFMKHADDAIFGLIRLKDKPFPTQEELVDRLDANVQWAQYKTNVISEFVYQKHARR